MTETTPHDLQNFDVLQREFQRTLNRYFDLKSNLHSDRTEAAKRRMIVAGCYFILAGVGCPGLAVFGTGLLVAGRTFPSETRKAAKDATKLYNVLHRLNPERTKFFMEKFGRDGIERGMLDGQFTAFKRRPPKNIYNGSSGPFSPL